MNDDLDAALRVDSVLNSSQAAALKNMYEHELQGGSANVEPSMMVTATSSDEEGLVFFQMTVFDRPNGELGRSVKHFFIFTCPAEDMSRINMHRGSFEDLSAALDPLTERLPESQVVPSECDETGEAVADTIEPLSADTLT